MRSDTKLFLNMMFSLFVIFNLSSCGVGGVDNDENTDSTLKMNGAYNLFGLQTQFRSSGGFKKASFEGVMNYDGNNGLSGSITENEIVLDNFLTPILISKSTETTPLDGSTYTNDSNGNVINKISGDSVNSFASIDRDKIFFETDFDEFSSSGDIGRGFMLSLKQGAGMNESSANGIYHFIGIESQFLPSLDFHIGVLTSEMAFNGSGDVTGNNVVNQMEWNDFANTSLLEKFIFTDSLDSLTYTVSNTGGFSFHMPDETEVVGQGSISADSQMIAISLDTDSVQGIGNDGRGVFVGVKQGSEMSNLDVAGTYRFFGLQMQFRAPFGLVAESLSGSLIFDDSEGISGSLSGNQMIWDDVKNANTISTDTEIIPFNAVTYSVSSSGKISFHDQEGTWSGYISADGNVIIAEMVFDALITNSSGDLGRGMLIAVKQN